MSLKLDYTPSETICGIVFHHKQASILKDYFNSSLKRKHALNRDNVLRFCKYMRWELVDL
jgi:hypothetical protein